MVSSNRSVVGVVIYGYLERVDTDHIAISPLLLALGPFLNPLPLFEDRKLCRGYFGSRNYFGSRDLCRILHRRLDRYLGWGTSSWKPLTPLLQEPCLRGVLELYMQHVNIASICGVVRCLPLCFLSLQHIIDALCTITCRRFFSRRYHKVIKTILRILSTHLHQHIPKDLAPDIPKR